MRRMYDSVDPSAIPANAQMVAGYIDGNRFRWPESAWSRFRNAVKVRIARRVTTNDGHVLDVEAGIPTVWPPSPAIVAWVEMRRRAGIEPTIYCNQLNDWPGIRALFRDANVREPLYWVARYNNVAEIPAGAIAKQYANAPLAGGNFDLSVVADFWPGVDLGVSDMDANDPNFLALCGRMLALVQGTSTVTWGPTAGEGVWLVSQLKKMEETDAAQAAELHALIQDGVRLAATGEIVVKPTVGPA